MAGDSCGFHLGKAIIYSRGDSTIEVFTIRVYIYKFAGGYLIGWHC